MAEDRDAQSPSRAPVTRSKAEKQQKVPRPSRPDRPPRRHSSTKTSAQHFTGPPDIQDPKNAPIMAPLQFQSTVNPSNRDQGASQPCARLRQLTAVDGGAALQRLYAIIQRQRDEWYQSNFPPTPMATPASPVEQNEQTSLNVSQMDGQGRTFVTPDVAEGGTTGLVFTGYTEISRVVTPATGSGTSGLGSMKQDQGQTTKTLSSEVTPASFRESQSVRFQTPLRSCEPLSLQPSGLLISKEDLLSNGTPLQEKFGGAPTSTSFQLSGETISRGTLEFSTFQRPTQDISGGTLQSGSLQLLGRDTAGGSQQASFQRPGPIMTGETAQLSSFQQIGQDAKGETQKSKNLQELGPEEATSNTLPKSLGQSGIDMSGAAAQHPAGTLYSNVLPQSDIQKPGTSPMPQSFEKLGVEVSGGSYGSLAQQMDLQKSGMASQRPSFQQQVTQPGNQMPLDSPPPGPSGVQAPVGSRPEAYHSDRSGLPVPGQSSIPEWSQQSSMQACFGSLQHLESPLSPGASGMQMSKEPSRQSPMSLCPAESGNQMPEGNSLKTTTLIPEGQYQYSSQVSKPLKKSDLVSEKLRGYMPKSHLRYETAGTTPVPRRRTVATTGDPQSFEEQVSAEFQILKELASSLKNIRYIPTPVASTAGPAFENCVLSEIRSIRSRCTAYSQSGIYNQPKFSSQGIGGGVATGSQPVSQALGPQDLSQGQGLREPSQVSAFEKQVIATLRSMTSSCKGGETTSVDQRLSSVGTSPGPSPSRPTRAFEEFVLRKLNELGTEFGCQQATQPEVSQAVPAVPSQPSSEAVLPATTLTSGTSETHPLEPGVAPSTDSPQQDSNQPDQPLPRSSTTQHYGVSSKSGVGAIIQPMEPSYIKASSQGTTPINRQIGSLTFDTTMSTPARISRTEQSGPVQNQVEVAKEATSVEDKLRRETFEADVRQQSITTDERKTQAQSRADQLPRPPNISWTENSASFQRILQAPQNDSQMQETIYVQPTYVAQQIPRAPAGRYDGETDECETGSLEDSDSDLESVDSCSAESLAFVHRPCDPDIKRQLHQTFLECDYAYRASELAALIERRPRQSMPAKLPTRKIVGQGSQNAPAELTQYTMSETQPSKIPLGPDPQSICEPGSTYTRPKSSAKIPLSSTLKEGHVPPMRVALPPELPSTIESAPRRSSLTQENLSTGEYDATQVLRTGSLEQRCGPNGPQRPLSQETGRAPGSPFDCSGIYYRVAPNAPVVDSRCRQVAFSSACDQVDQAIEEPLCWDDERCGFAATQRYESECTAESGFPRRPCATSMERAGLSRGTFGKACSTPWPSRARPSGAGNRWPPLQALDSSCERPTGGTRKTLADSPGRCSSKRRRGSYGKTFTRPQPIRASGTDPRCSSRNAEHIRTEVTNRMMDCMGVGPNRSRYTHDPCTSSESESDSEC